MPDLQPINVTLASTGEIVSTSDPQWRDECLTRQRHVWSMRSLDRLGRHDYVLSVRRKEGDLAADRLVQAYGDDWARRKARLAAVQTPLDATRSA